MNVDVMAKEDIESIAMTVASVVFGGINQNSQQWQKCLDTAAALRADGVALPKRNRWLEARVAFDLCQGFNTQCPTGTEGILQPDYGPQIATKVEQSAMVFPHPFEGQQVMAWFDRVGWCPVEKFQPSVKKMTLAEELMSVALSTKQVGKLELTKAILTQAIACDPTYWHAINELGVILVAQQRYAEALDCYERAMAIEGNSAEVINNRGTALRNIGRTFEAIADLKRAWEMLPDNPMVPLNLASTLDDSGDIEAALKVLDERIAKTPNDSTPSYNKALLLLSNGRLEEGWRLYHTRLYQPMVNTHYEHYGFQHIVTDNFADKTVLVWGEQGLGDEIFISSMLPDLIAHTTNVTFLCSNRLLPLMARSFPEITVDARPTAQLVDLFKREKLRPELLPPSLRGRKDIDFQMSQADLGAAFRPTMESFPKRDGFLKCDHAMRDLHRGRLLEDGKPLVGISWHSSKNPKIGDLKSVRLEKWRDILTTPGVTFVNLQYGDTSDIEEAEKLFGVKIKRVEDLNFEKDLDGFASLVAAMDLVISTSNTTIHMAGGLNVPCWVMTPQGPGKLWYFFTEIENLPWYSSVRLYRQRAASQWDDVLARIATDFKAWVSCSSSR